MEFSNFIVGFAQVSQITSFLNRNNITCQHEKEQGRFRASAWRPPKIGSSLIAEFPVRCQQVSMRKIAFSAPARRDLFPGARQGRTPAEEQGGYPEVPAKGGAT